MDTFFYAHSRVGEGLYRFAGCFECAGGGLTKERLHAAVLRVVERYPEVFVVDPNGARAAPVLARCFATERELRNFYAECLSKPFPFGNVLLRAFLLDKPDGSRTLFLLVPHFAGDSKIASFVLGEVLSAADDEKPVEKLAFVSYRELARKNTRGKNHISLQHKAVCKRFRMLLWQFGAHQSCERAANGVTGGCILKYFTVRKGFPQVISFLQKQPRAL